MWKIKSLFLSLSFIVVAVSSAYAMIGPGLSLTSVPSAYPLAVGNGFLDGVLDSAIFDLDATIEASTDGSSQTWTDLLASGHDMYRGADGSASTDDPTFNGTPGDSSAYWSFDGGDYYTLTGANTPFINSLHHSDSTFWVAIAANFASVSTWQRVVFSRGDETDGIAFSLSATGGLHIVIEQNNTTKSVAFGSGLAISTDYLIIASFDVNAGTIRYSINNDTLSESSATLNSGTGDNDADSNITFMADPPGGFFINGTKLYSLAMGNELLNDIKNAAIRAHIAARHERSY